MSFKNLKVEFIKHEVATELLNQYQRFKRGFVKVGEKKWFLPLKYVKKDNNIYNFDVCPDDT